MTTPYPRIPYGEASFARIRRNGWLYVDKTRFVRPLEEERYAFFIRPRRFGKSCWLSLLECYYGRHWADEFETLFGDTDIARAPTAERHRYVVVRFNFSTFDDTLETLQERFEYYCYIRLQGALERNADLFPEAVTERILSAPAIDGKLNALFEYAGDRGIPVCVLIDEYDNFANTVLAHRGREAYESFTHGGGFYRNFFATLKAGAGETGGLERLFITGVSPITMDDVTSGFNIGANITLEPEFNEVLGFTEPEVRGLLETYRDRGAFDQDVDAAFLAAHFSVVGHFLIHSERELNKGYADLHLEPFLARYPDVAFGYVMELKYLRRSETVDEGVVARKMDEARAQLVRYLADEGLRRRMPSVRHVGLAVVFHGWEMAACEAVGDGADAPTGS